MLDQVIANKRAAKHIVIRFSVTRTGGRFRMRVGGDIEHEDVDELQQPTWVKIRGVEPPGLPSKASLLAAALTLVFSDLPPFEDRRLYPTGVYCMGTGQNENGPGSVVYIDLGAVTP